MTPLLLQFISETRDLIQGISEKLLEVEKNEDPAETLNELFRLVHTLKGNTGLFEFPDLTRILHAGEDVMSEKRESPSQWDHELTDLLFETLDYISQFCDNLEETDGEPVSDALLAQELEKKLRQHLKTADGKDKKPAVKTSGKKKSATKTRRSRAPDLPEDVPESLPLEKSVTQEERENAWLASRDIQQPVLVNYTPQTDCFFQGDDPLHLAMNTPGMVWGHIQCELSETPLDTLDPYQCVSRFLIICDASEAEIMEYFRYVPDQIQLETFSADQIPAVTGRGKKDAVPAEQLDDICRAIAAKDVSRLRSLCQTALDLMSPNLSAASALRWLLFLSEHDAYESVKASAQRLRQTQHQPPWEFDSSEQTADSLSEEQQAVSGESPATTAVSIFKGLEADEAEALTDILLLQQRILRMDDGCDWSGGRVRACASVIRNCCTSLHRDDLLLSIESSLELADNGDIRELDTWLTQVLSLLPETVDQPLVLQETTDIEDEEDQDEDYEDNEDELTGSNTEPTDPENVPETPLVTATQPVTDPGQAKSSAMDDANSRTPSGGTSRSVKVDQEKIDRLMNLIGEMTVAKNALPFLAKRAEEMYGVRELSREIKEEYAVVNRIAEEMQDAIMQIRMMPFSFISMRFPRLVRDISRRLNKDIHLVIEGEDTEADKNIIESLAEPLIHIVRNSLDHGIELPDTRIKAGKSPAGNLTIRASQEADRVLIEIIDDGKGIDPVGIRQKAQEKGLIDEATAQRMTDREAVNLVLLPGFSTAEEISDISGRGVGMDAVRSAVEKVNGSMSIDSVPGKGTKTRISLPMSISVTRVMIVESDGQQMGVPMDQVLETVRVPKEDIHIVKHVRTTVLRDRVLPLRSLNDLLALPSEQNINDDGEYAVLVTRVGHDVIGLMVDEFRGSADIIQKPMQGVLTGLNAYSGAALIGDGSVLMVLNLKEIL